MIRNRRGVSALGYGLIVGLIAMAAILAVASTGGNIRLLLINTSNRLENAGTAASSGGGAAQQAALPVSCQAALSAGNTTSGRYTIDPDGAGAFPAFSAYCDMTTDGGGWLLLGYNDQTSTFSTANFKRPWADYKAGFGGPAGGTQSLGWLGLDRMHALTASPREFRVLNTDTNSILRPHRYNGFQVANEANFYRLSVSSYGASNDADIFVTQHNGMYFTTEDQDHDTNGGGNCATSFNTGWWHGNCFGMSLAGSADVRAFWRNSGGAQENSLLMSLWLR